MVLHEYFTMADLKQIARSIDRSHQEAIYARATSGQVRSFELIWVTLLMRHHNYQVVPSLTGKQRQNLRDYICRFGPEKALALMVFSVKNWGRARTLYQFLPPRPVFDSFYFHRDKFLAFMIEETERDKKSASATEYLKTIERMPRGAGKNSLVEMFKVARTKENGD